MRTVLLVFAGVFVSSCGLLRKPCEEVTNSCDCAERTDCHLVTDGCWCPSECNPDIQCVCGGGKFVRCEKKAL